MNILFMCVANSIRSQMAEGLAKKILGQGIRVESAGSRASRIHPYAAEAMQEIGIDISAQHSKGIGELADDFIQNLNYVVTLCEEEVCPLILSPAQKLHWPHPDPSSVIGGPEEVKRAFRTVRNQIQSKLEELAELIRVETK